MDWDTVFESVVAEEVDAATAKKMGVKAVCALARLAIVVLSVESNAPVVGHSGSFSLVFGVRQVGSGVQAMILPQKLRFMNLMRDILANTALQHPWPHTACCCLRCNLRS